MLTIRTKFKSWKFIKLAPSIMSKFFWAVLTQLPDPKDCQNIHRFIDFLALFKESKWRLAKISNG